jgi:hypothetical protein
MVKQAHEIHAMSNTNQIFDLKDIAFKGPRPKSKYLPLCGFEGFVSEVTEDIFILTHLMDLFSAAPGQSD